MKKFYLHILLLCFSAVAFAQTPIFEITSPSAIAGSLGYGTSVGGTSAGVTYPAWGYQLKSKQDFVAGEVAIAMDTTQTDSTKTLEGCNAIGSKVKGKFALIRRGTCNGDIKVFTAQKAGAIGVIYYLRETDAQTVFNLLGVDTAQTKTINIPVFIITYADAQKIVKSIGAANKVTVRYRYPTFGTATSSLHYATPYKESQPYNLVIQTPKFLKSEVTPTDSLPRVAITITEPGGAIVKPTVSSAVVYNFTAKDSLRQFVSGLYNPKKVGKYKIAYSNDKNTEVFQDSFVLTNYTFAQDNLGPSEGAVYLDSASFVKGNLINDAGHFINSGGSPDKATHIMFAIDNPKDIPVGDAFVLQLFKFSQALFDKLGNGLTYDDLTAVATATYKMTGKETPDSLLVTELKTPVDLVDSSDYLVMVRYDGSGSGNTKAPAYSIAGRTGYAYFTDLLYQYDGTKANTFYTGYSARYAQKIRLAMAGYKPGALDTKTTEAWAENQVTVFPNPVNTQLTLNFNLQTLNPTVDYLITSVEGLEIKAGQFKNVQTGTQTINVSEFANGLYFVRLLGTDGWRTKAFVVTK